MKMILAKLSDSGMMTSAKRLRTCLPQAGIKFSKNAGTPKEFCEYFASLFNSIH